MLHGSRQVGITTEGEERFDDPVDQREHLGVQPLVEPFVESGDQTGQQHRRHVGRLGGRAVEPLNALQRRIAPVRDVELGQFRQRQHCGVEVASRDLITLLGRREVLEQEEEVVRRLVEGHVVHDRGPDVEAGSEVPVERRLRPVVAECDPDTSALWIVGGTLRHHGRGKVVVRGVGQGQSEARGHLTRADRFHLDGGDLLAQRLRQRLGCQSIHRSPRLVTVPRPSCPHGTAAPTVERSTVGPVVPSLGWDTALGTHRGSTTWLSSCPAPSCPSRITCPTSSQDACTSVTTGSSTPSRPRAHVRRPGTRRLPWSRRTARSTRDSSTCTATPRTTRCRCGPSPDGWTRGPITTRGPAPGATTRRSCGRPECWDTRRAPHCWPSSASRP